MIGIAGVPGLRCRRSGHAVTSERLSVTVARVRDMPAEAGISDDIARYWMGYKEQSVPDIPGQAHDVLLWFTSNMAFFARCRAAGELIAAIWLYQQAGGYHVGGKVGPHHRGRGYGREALDLVCRVAHRHLGIGVLTAGCEVSNVASRRWLSSCGFVPADGPSIHVLPNGRIIRSLWFRRSAAARLRCWNRPVAVSSPPEEQLMPKALP